MIRIRVALLAALTAAGVAVLSACSTNAGTPNVAPAVAAAADFLTGTAQANGAPQNTGDFAAPGDTDAAEQWVELDAGSAGGLNPVVLNGKGFTLYRFDKDSPKPPTSNCNGACAKTWPPVLVKPGSRIFVNGVSVSKIGVLTRADGSRQVSIGGWPVYRFSGDKKAGDTNGEGVGGTWFAVSPTGGKTLPKGGLLTTPPSSQPAAPGTSAPATPVTLGNGSATLDSGKNFSEPNGSSGVAGPGCVPVPRPAQVSSIQLSGGPVKLWKGPNCTGQSMVITSSVPDLAAIGFDQQVVSIRFGDK